MPAEVAELDQLQTNYKSAVEFWIAAIRREEALASVNHSVAEIDKWENAAMDEEEARQKAKSAKKPSPPKSQVRQKAKSAKKAYEDALRQKFFNF